jgi:transcriptional repressor NrdR
MVEQIVTEIEDETYSLGKASREVTTADIGELVLKRLYEIDKVAYIRFASVYKHFEDLDEFITEVKSLEDQAKQKKVEEKTEEKSSEEDFSLKS